MSAQLGGQASLKISDDLPPVVIGIREARKTNPEPNKIQHREADGSSCASRLEIEQNIILCNGITNQAVASSGAPQSKHLHL